MENTDSHSDQNALQALQANMTTVLADLSLIKQKLGIEEVTQSQDDKSLTDQTLRQASSEYIAENAPDYGELSQRLNAENPDYRMGGTSLLQPLQPDLENSGVYNIGILKLLLKIFSRDINKKYQEMAQSIDSDDKAKKDFIYFTDLYPLAFLAEILNSLE